MSQDTKKRKHPDTENDNHERWKLVPIEIIDVDSKQMDRVWVSPAFCQLHFSLSIAVLQKPLLIPGGVNAFNVAITLMLRDQDPPENLISHEELLNLFCIALQYNCKLLLKRCQTIYLDSIVPSESNLYKFAILLFQNNSKTTHRYAEMASQIFIREHTLATTTMALLARYWLASLSSSDYTPLLLDDNCSTRLLTLLFEHAILYVRWINRIYAFASIYYHLSAKDYSIIQESPWMHLLLGNLAPQRFHTHLLERHHFMLNG
jgi:hypothetical protein